MKRWISISALLLIATFVLTACPAPTPQIVEVPKEVVVEKRVVETVVVEKEVSVEKIVKETVIVEKDVVVTPEPVPEILIGLVQPLSGASAPSGLENKFGAEVAVDIINNVHPDLDLPFAKTSGIPNLGGAKLKLIVGDHAGNPEKGMSEAERLITEKNIVALVGMNFSSVTAAAQPVAERYKVPFLSIGASSPSLHQQGYQWWFRTGLHDEMYSKAMFEFLTDLREEEGIELKTLGLLYEDTLFGMTSAEVQKRLAEEYGFEVVADVQYHRGSSNLDTEIQRLKAANPDVMMPASYLADAILIVQNSKDLDYNPSMVLAQGGTMTLGAFLEVVGEDAEGYITRSAWSPELVKTNPAIVKVNELYRDKVGYDMGNMPPLMIQGFLVLADAINRAGSTDPEAIRQALLETDVPADQLFMPWDGVKFDPETHQNTEAKPVMRQLHEGQYHTVWPFDLAAMDPIVPIPQWSDR